MLFFSIESTTAFLRTKETILVINDKKEIDKNLNLNKVTLKYAELA